MKRRVTFSSALVALVLAMLPLQSEAFFFGFSFGSGGWWHPSYYGWHNPYHYGYGHRYLNYGYSPYRHYAYNHRPYRYRSYTRIYRPWIKTPTILDAPELVAEK